MKTSSNILNPNLISGIYKITSPSGRIYIGQTTNFKRRFNSYKTLNSKTKRQIRLWRSFIKYGVENHNIVILEKCDVYLLNIKERFWQDYYKVIYENGLNCVLQSTTEKRRILSEEVKQKISKTLLKGNHKPSKENLEKTRLRMIGNKHRLGHVIPKDVRGQISQTMKDKRIGCGNKNGMYRKTGIDNKNCKIIICLNTGVFFYGIKEAAKAKGYSYSTMKKKMSGDRFNDTELIYA